LKGNQEIVVIHGPHSWEEIPGPGFKCLRGERRCVGVVGEPCNILFLNDKRRKELDDGIRGYLPSTKKLIYRCKKCFKLWCAKCKVKRDMGSPKRRTR
jgi:hypothetical protein